MKRSKLKCPNCDKTDWALGKTFARKYAYSELWCRSCDFVYQLNKSDYREAIYDR